MLSNKAKYALKALEFLAENKKNEPLRIAEIAESQGFPQKFLEAILLELRKDGILKLSLGRQEGICSTWIRKIFVWDTSSV